MIDFKDMNVSLTEKISVKTHRSVKDGLVRKTYQLLPKFGVGSIHQVSGPFFCMTIREYELFEDRRICRTFENSSWQLSFLLKGKKILHPGRPEEMPLEEGESLMFQIPQSKTYVRILGGHLFKEVDIRLSASFLAEQGIADTDISGLFNKEHLIVPISDKLLSIIDDLQNDHFPAMMLPLYLKAKLLELICEMMQVYNLPKAILGNENSEGILKKIYRVRHLIKSNLHKNFTLTVLANQVGTNSTTLNKHFTAVFGYSIYDFAVAEKMNHARFLLENSQKMIYQVAESVGYKNATHFTAAFKKRLGLTPTKVRKGFLH